MSGYIEFTLTVIAVITLIISGSQSNAWLRGADAFPGSRYVNALLFGFESYFFNHDCKLGIYMAVAMVIAQFLGIPHNQAIKGNVWPMFFRGILWVVPIMIAVVLAGYCPIWYVPTALSMYLVYHGADQWFLGRKQTDDFNQVKLAEYLYGAMLWLPIAFIKYHIALLCGCWLHSIF